MVQAGCGRPRISRDIVAPNVSVRGVRISRKVGISAADQVDPARYVSRGRMEVGCRDSSSRAPCVTGDVVYLVEGAARAAVERAHYVDLPIVCGLAGASHCYGNRQSGAAVPCIGHRIEYPVVGALEPQLIVPADDVYLAAGAIVGSAREETPLWVWHRGAKAPSVRRDVIDLRRRCLGEVLV